MSKWLKLKDVVRWLSKVWFVRHLLQRLLMLLYGSKTPTIYLTFDDGPNAGTLNCLDVCRGANVPATFFLIGKQSLLMPEVVRALSNESDNILICNHSHSHANNSYSAFYRNLSMVEKDFILAAEFLQTKTNIIRLPGRNIWLTDNYLRNGTAAPVYSNLAGKGFQLIGWDCEYAIGSGALSDINRTLIEIYLRLLFGKTKIKGHLVLLLHDSNFTNASKVERLRFMIEPLKEMFSFSTVEEHPFLAR